MVFSSISFLFYFLPLILALYFLAPAGTRNFILLIGSLFFYAWGEPVYVLLMLFSILFNYLFGRFLDTQGKRRGAVLAAAVVLNLLLLGFFKYADFFVDTINAALGLRISLLELPLPIGISFYTFQAMSYLLDLYRGHVRVQKNIINFGTYVALFPQLIAGPIIRIKTVEDQLLHRKTSMVLFASGVRRFAAGLAKKVLLANNMGLIWDSVSATDAGELSVLTAWIGIAAFTFQIYFDFSGYSDMAIGLGRMFGFEFPENFRYPYCARSITEFWRRWHISLSTWFKEYVYIPLGGNRKGAARQIRNILVVWFLTGLWHGASWNFAVWGVYFAVLLILEKLFLLRWLEHLPFVFRRIYSLVLVMISWVIFSLNSLAAIGEYLLAMFGGAGAGFADRYSWYLLLGNLLLFAVSFIGATPLPARAAETLRSRADKNLGAAVLLENAALFALLFFSVAYIVSSTYNPFLYFRF